MRQSPTPLRSAAPWIAANLAWLTFGLLAVFAAVPVTGQTLTPWPALVLAWAAIGTAITIASAPVARTATDGPDRTLEGGAALWWSVVAATVWFAGTAWTDGPPGETSPWGTAALPWAVVLLVVVVLGCRGAIELHRRSLMLDTLSERVVAGMAARPLDEPQTLRTEPPPSVRQRVATLLRRRATASELDIYDEAIEWPLLDVSMVCEDHVERLKRLLAWLRLRDGLLFRVQVDRAARLRRIPASFLYTLVENALAHGEPRNGALRLAVLIVARGSEGVRITVANTGRLGPVEEEPGTDNARRRPRALQRLRSRLEREYPGRHRLTLAQHGNWVRAMVELGQPGAAEEAGA